MESLAPQMMWTIAKLGKYADVELLVVRAARLHSCLAREVL